jgi:hypothetical protein
MLRQAAPVENRVFFASAGNKDGSPVKFCICHVRGGAEKSLARLGRKSYSDQTRDLFNIIPTKHNTLLSP